MLKFVLIKLCFQHNTANSSLYLLIKTFKFGLRGLTNAKHKTTRKGRNNFG